MRQVSSGCDLFCAKKRKYEFRYLSTYFAREIVQKITNFATYLLQISQKYCTFAANFLYKTNPLY